MVSASTWLFDVPSEPIAALCGRWSVTKLALLGSVLRDDVGPDSEIDMLAEFGKEARHTLFDMDRMKEKLEDIFWRDVDLFDWRGVERRPECLCRKAILQSAEVVHGS